MITYSSLKLLRSKRSLNLILAAITLGAVATGCLGDVIEMVNGDQYSGTVLSVNLTNVTVRSEVQGTIILPRAKVGRITFRELATVAPGSEGQGLSAVQSPRATAAPDFSQHLRPKGADTNFVARIQQEMLSQAGPEAERKYQELTRGLLSGSLSVSDLRKQAQQTLQESEAIKAELGPEASEMLDGYLEILRRFLEESSDSPATPPR